MEKAPSTHVTNVATLQVKDKYVRRAYLLGFKIRLSLAQVSVMAVGKFLAIFVNLESLNHTIDGADHLIFTFQT